MFSFWKCVGTLVYILGRNMEYASEEWGAIGI